MRYFQFDFHAFDKLQLFLSQIMLFQFYLVLHLFVSMWYQTFCQTLHIFWPDLNWLDFAPTYDVVWWICFDIKPKFDKLYLLLIQIMLFQFILSPSAVYPLKYLINSFQFDFKLFPKLYISLDLIWLYFTSTKVNVWVNFIRCMCFKIFNRFLPILFQTICQTLHTIWLLLALLCTNDW